jgi:hypothetical protein
MSMNAKSTSVFKAHDIAETMSTIHDKYAGATAYKASNKILLIGEKPTESIISLKMDFQFMECGSMYFGRIARILQRLSCSIMFKSDIMTWLIATFNNISVISWRLLISIERS